MSPTREHVARKKPAKRRYESRLREEQAQETRARILRAAATHFCERGWHDFSVAAVAEAAGVAHRTVYRYFPTRDALIEGLREWYEGLDIEMPQTLDGLADAPTTLFEIFDENAEIILALLNSEVGPLVHGPGRARRNRMLDRILDAEAGELEAAERRRILGAIRALLSSQSWRTLREELGMSGAESGEAVSWALRALVGEIRRRAAAARRRDGAG